jgi:hypothetical protein
VKTEIMTDQEINEAVARKLGWTFHDHDCSGEKAFGVRWNITGPHWIPPVKTNHHFADLPDYCHSISAAWEIVEKNIHVHQTGHDGIEQIADFFLERQTNEWVAGWRVWNSLSDRPIFNLSARSLTAPTAICLAFLKLEQEKDLT